MISSRALYMNAVGNWAYDELCVEHNAMLGASLPDPTGILEGEGDTSRVARFLDEADLAAKEEGLRGLVAAWIELKG